MNSRERWEAKPKAAASSNTKLMPTLVPRLLNQGTHTLSLPLNWARARMKHQERVALQAKKNL